MQSGLKILLLLHGQLKSWSQTYMTCALILLPLAPNTSFIFFVNICKNTLLERSRPWYVFTLKLHCACHQYWTRASCWKVACPWLKSFWCQMICLQCSCSLDMMTDIRTSPSTRKEEKNCLSTVSLGIPTKQYASVKQGRQQFAWSVRGSSMFNRCWCWMEDLHPFTTLEGWIRTSLCYVQLWLWCSILKTERYKRVKKHRELRAPLRRLQ